MYMLSTNQTPTYMQINNHHMRNLFILLLAMQPFTGFAQLGIGIKGGLNFANVSGAGDINSSSRSGFNAGIFLAPHSKGIIGSRTEILFSRQGYSFNSGETTGNVYLNYIVLPQFMTINITRFVTLQVGVQLAYLLNARADSSASSSPGGMGTGAAMPYGNIMSFYNKYDYGFGAGVEIHPVAGLLIGARYNVGLNKIYSSLGSGQAPAFSSAQAKNNVVQLFAGWIFGGKSK
jgi:hypothetical protein